MIYLQIIFWALCYKNIVLKYKNSFSKLLIVSFNEKGSQKKILSQKILERF